MNPHTVAMSSDAWPHPDAQRGPLPRIDDLPLAEQGYEQEAVRAAFDAFYRHAAQLDASLRALEAVEVFRRDADALRNDLRAIRELGGFGAGEPGWATQTYERASPDVPMVAFRLLAEAALIIAVAVIAGVSHLATSAIVALMAGAFVLVALSEWLAARARFVSPASGFVTSELLEPAPYVEAPPPQEAEAADASSEWDEDTEPESLTVVGAAAPSVAEGDAGYPPGVGGFAAGASSVDPWEQSEDASPEDTESHGFLRRLRR